MSSWKMLDKLEHNTLHTLKNQCVEYVRFWVFIDTLSPVLGQILPLYGKNGSVKTCIFAYLMQSISNHSPN